MLIIRETYLKLMIYIQFIYQQICLKINTILKMKIQLDQLRLQDSQYLVDTAIKSDVKNDILVEWVDDKKIYLKYGSV